MADDKIKKLVALLKKMPKTDRGYSWELRDAYGNEAIRAYGANAAAFKFILDHADELIVTLSKAEKRERETLTQLSEIAKTAAGDLVEKWRSDLGATVETKAAGAASHIVNDFRGHIEAALIKLERRAALERSEG